MTDGPSQIDFEAVQKDIAESMRWATLAVTYDELSKEAKSVARDMKSYSLASALPILSGLLTVPDYQSNCIRIEVLVGLAILHCAGRKKANLGRVALWYRQIGQTRCVTGEDPAEDVFVTLIHSDEGNFRMLEGVWENAGFYTQCVAEVIEGLPATRNLEPLKRSFLALLKISDAVCERANLERYQLGDDTRKAELRLAKIAKKNALMNRVTFSSSEFDDLGIAPGDIFPFLSNREDLKDLSSQTPGDSFCEHRPIVQIGPDKFVIALPSALSVCARNLVINFMISNSFEAQFDNALSSVFSKIIHETPLLGGPTRAPVYWRNVDGFKFSTFSLEIDDGYILSFHLFLPSISAHPNGGFKYVFHDDGSVARQIKKSIESAIEEADGRSQIKGGLALFVGCGWGKGYATQEFEFVREGWMFESISISDLIRVSWLHDISTEYFFQVQHGLQAANKAGLNFQNLNGVLSLIAWARKNNGHLIPHGSFLDVEFTEDRPTMLSVPQNLLRELRAQSDQGRDRHRAMDNQGRWHVVQRVNSSPHQSNNNKNLYASVDDVGEGKLTAVFESKLQAWITISAPGFEKRDTVFRLWEMAREWLPRIVMCVSERFPSATAFGPVMLQLIFEGSGNIDLTRSVPSHEKLDESMSIEAGPDQNALSVVLQDGFLDGFRNPTNVAERVIAKGLLRAILIHTDSEQAQDVISEMLDQIVPNDAARSFHVMHGHTFLQYVQDALPDKLVSLNETDDAVAKLGMGLKARTTRTGNKVSGVSECTSFLNEVVDGLLSGLYNDLSEFRRETALTRIYENVEKANAEEDHWRRTSAALLGLHGDNPETVQDYVEQSSKFSGASLAGRILIEIGLCVCPVEVGEDLSRLELSRMMAKASLISQLGGLSDAIKYHALPPELHVSPFGDILFKDDFGDFVVQPLLSDAIGKRFTQLALSQQANYSEPYILPSVKEKFDAEFWEIWSEEMGFEIDQGRLILDQIDNKGIEKNRAVYKIRRSELADFLASKGIAKDVIYCFLDRFTLAARESWDKPPDGFELKDIYPWRFGRRLSLVSRPILQIDEQTDPTLIVAPNALRIGLMYVISGAYSGRFDQLFFNTTRMKNEWLGKASEGHSYTRSVADRLEDAGWTVRVEIGLPHILNKKFADDPGDVDVLAWKKDRNEILVIECKDLSFARNYSEVAHMLSEFQGAEIKGKPDKLKRHLQRVEMLLNNRAGLETFCRIDDAMVKSALVCSGTVPMQFAKVKALKETYVGGAEGLIAMYS